MKLTQCSIRNVLIKATGFRGVSIKQLLERVRPVFLPDWPYRMMAREDMITLLRRWTNDTITSRELWWEFPACEQNFSDSASSSAATLNLRLFCLWNRFHCRTQLWWKRQCWGLTLMLLSSSPKSMKPIISKQKRTPPQPATQHPPLLPPHNTQKHWWLNTLSAEKLTMSTYWNISLSEGLRSPFEEVSEHTRLWKPRQSCTICPVTRRCFLRYRKEWTLVQTKDPIMVEIWKIAIVRKGTSRVQSTLSRRKEGFARTTATPTKTYLAVMKIRWNPQFIFITATPSTKRSSTR